MIDVVAWESSIYTGKWEEATGGAFDTIDPATGDVLGTVGVASESQIELAGNRAAIAQREWAACSYEERARVLREAGRLWEIHHSEIEQWIVRESGAVISKARSETRAAAQECFEAAALASSPWGEVLRSVKDRLSLSRRVPAGVVSVIAPFNFPLALAIRSVAPALALGNAVLLKPDPRTTVSGGVSLVSIFEKAGLPSGVLQLLPGSKDVGEAITANKNVRIIAFTGSNAAGREVGAVASRLMKRAHLELGGNSALIVLSDADLPKAILAGAWGSFRHQGQICMATSRHLIHESLVDDYVTGLGKIANQIKSGDPFDESVLLGPVIDSGQRDKIHELVTSSVDAGAQLVAGGTFSDLFYRPTVLGNVTPEMAAFSQEVFGPVAPVTSFSDIDEAVDLANSTEYGLSAGIMTRNVMAGVNLASQLHCGAVHINDQTINDEAVAPFGGMGTSGNGARFGGPMGNLDAYSEVQWLTARGEIPDYFA